MIKENYRKCVSCKETKLATCDNFYKDKSRPLGLMYRCKDCDKKRKDNRISSDRIKNESIEQRNKRLERLSKYNKSEKGKSISLSYRYKHIDKEKGYDNDIDYEYLRQSRKLECFYCGFKSTGLDRIDNKKGHTKENTVPCCKECNTARMDNFSHDEMIILGKTIRDIKMKRIFKDYPHFQKTRGNTWQSLQGKEKFKDGKYEYPVI